MKQLGKFFLHPSLPPRCVVGRPSFRVILQRLEAMYDSVLEECRTDVSLFGQQVAASTTSKAFSGSHLVSAYHP